MRKFKISAAAVLVVSAVALAPAAMAESETVAGEVVKVDQSAGKITLKHGPIKKFDMDMGMTMVFRASDPAALKTIKAGDKVKFEPEQVNGQYTVMKIEKLK